MKTILRTALLICLFHPVISHAQSTTLVISQVYGGAGCGTAGCSTYKNDYIEIFNLSASPVSVNGWSVQYTSATGSAWQVTTLPNVSIPAGAYLLVAEAAGANGVNTVPTPDVAGTIAMSATAAKVALVNTTTALSGACPTGPQIIDLIGYGLTANCFEGAPASSPSSTNAAVRATGGCGETNNNSIDFTASPANPRNSASPLASCSVLPVRFVDFKGSYNSAANTISLIWITAQENNSKDFLVQRLVNGMDWTTIGTVNAAGNSNSPLTYAFTDPNPRNGVNLYRIQQVDIDGKSVFSSIKSIKTSGILSFQLFPNPTHGIVYITTDPGNTTDALITITDVSGKIVYSNNHSVSANNAVSIDLSGYMKGIYMVKCASKENVVVEKLVVW